MTPSPELPIDGPSPLRVIGGGACALVGTALALGGPPLCIQAALQATAQLPVDVGSAARAQEGAQRWTLISSALSYTGMGLVLVGVLVLALTPGRRPSPHQAQIARATRPYGIAGTTLATALMVALVGWLSNSARAVAALEVFQELAARVPYARPFGPSEGERTGMLLGILSGLVYLGATVMFVPIARGLRFGAEDAIARTSRWAGVAVAVVLVDAATSALGSLAFGAPMIPAALRVVVLAPWPVLLWTRARSWKGLVRAEEPDLGA